MGSLVVFVFSIMLRFGVQAMQAQEVQHEAFRKALYLADQASSTKAGTPVNAATILVMRDESNAEPSDPFGTSASYPVAAGAAIEWGNELTDVKSLDPNVRDVTYRVYGQQEDTPQLVTDELPKAFYDINGKMFAFDSAGFFKVLQANGTPYFNPDHLAELRKNDTQVNEGDYQTDNPLCLLAQVISRATFFGEVVVPDGQGGWKPLDPDPQRANLSVKINTASCLSSILAPGSATVEVVANTDFGKALLKFFANYRVRFWVMDPCMADAIDMTVCQRQCEELQPPDVVRTFQLPLYCQGTMVVNQTGAAPSTGFDPFNYQRTLRTNNWLHREERKEGQVGAGKVSTTTHVDETEALHRIFRRPAWKGDAVDLSTGVRRDRNDEWVTPQ